jgi:hypothetical protein
VRLVRRREIPVPTAAGWLLLALLAAGLGQVALRRLYPFLAPQAPVGHGVLVVEGWLSEDAFDAAAAVWRSGGYTLLVTTGGPLERGPLAASVPSFAEFAARSLEQRGVPRTALAVVPAPASAQDRTFLSAVMVRDWVESRGEQISALDVVSEAAHARRTWLLYRAAFGDELPIGIRAAPPHGYDPEAWWRTTGGVKDVLAETIGWAYVACCFDPGPRGSHEERWGPRQRPESRRRLRVRPLG